MTLLLTKSDRKMDNYSKIRVVGRGKNELLFSSELPYSEICKIVEKEDDC